MSVVAAQKHYAVDVKSISERYGSREIVFVAATSTGKVVCSYLRTTRSQKQREKNYEPLRGGDDRHVDELDTLEEGDMHEKKKKQGKPPMNRCELEFVTSFTKSLSIKMCLGVLEEIAAMYLRPQVVSKLVKSMSKSAIRKFTRTHSRYAAGVLIFKAGIRASILGQVSIFLIEEAYQVVCILVERYKASKKSQDKKHSHNDDEEKNDSEELEALTMSFLRITSKNARRSGVAVVTSGIGAAVGTLIRPGLGTIIGATLGENITLGF